MRIIAGILVVGMVLTSGLIGCGQKPAASSQDAVQASKALASVEEQVKYLIGQANAFINSKQYDQAVSTAQYILTNLDQNSAEAKSILEKAKEQLAEAAKGAVSDVKNKLGTLGK